MHAHRYFRPFPTGCLASLVFCTLLAPRAGANFILPATAIGTLTLSDGGSTTQTTPLTFPSSDTFHFTRPSQSPPPVIDGAFSFTAGMQDTLAVMVQANSGVTGAYTHLILNFTTVQTASFHFVASAGIGGDVSSFQGKLDDIVAYRFNDLRGGSTNMPLLDDFILDGPLPAGAHTFSLDYVQSPSRHAPFLMSGQVAFSVTLSPAAVPLHPAIWPALVSGALLLISRRRTQSIISSVKEHRS